VNNQHCVLTINSLSRFRGIYHVILKGVYGFQSLKGLEQSKIVEIGNCQNLINVKAISSCSYELLVSK
jgi:hypothetical protein